MRKGQLLPNVPGHIFPNGCVIMIVLLRQQNSPLFVRLNSNMGNYLSQKNKTKESDIVSDCVL